MKIKGNDELKTMRKISEKFKKQAEIYKIFSDEAFDFSTKALENCFLYETLGCGAGDKGLFFESKINGYLYGKRMLNLSVTEWKKDIKVGILFMIELYENEKYPHWWLNTIFNRKKPPIKF